MQPVIDVFAGVQDSDLGTVAREVQKIIDDSKKDLPKGSNVVTRGQIQTEPYQLPSLGLQTENYAFDTTITGTGPYTF